MKRFQILILFIWSVIVSSCYPFIMADNLLIVEADVNNSVRDGNCEVILLDRNARELIKIIGDIQDNKLRADFTVATYNKEYFVIIMCSGMPEQYKSNIFSTSGAKTIVDLGLITTKPKKSL